MQMLERYLHAIEFWLPNAQKKDIIAEILEDIQSQIDDRQAELGRKLNDAELEALLKQRGRPVVVANRYRPQQSLIGPVWFPTYVFVLKIVGLCYVLPWLAVFLVMHRVQHPLENWGMTLLAAWATIWSVAFIAAGLVTLIFAVFQFTEARTHFLENWNPRELPPVRDPYRISRANSVAELVAGLVFVLWWMAYASSPVLFDGPAFKLALNPVWMYYFWGYLAVSLFNIGLAIANLRRPYWSTLRASCRLASDLAGGALFCWLVKVDILASIYIANMTPGQTLVLKKAIQVWMGISFPIAVIIVAIIAVVDLFRIVRVSRKGRHWPDQWGRSLGAQDKPALLDCEDGVDGRFFANGLGTDLQRWGKL